MTVVTPADPDVSFVPENPKAFKHGFNRAYIETLAARLRAATPAFDDVAYFEALHSLETLELKARVQLIASALDAGLPLPFPEAVRVLVELSAGAVDDAQPTQIELGVWPLSAFVGAHGLGHFEASMSALHALTQRSSAEFDIRPFLVEHPERTLAVLDLFVTDPSEHVRRLVSEGTRTRLPWGRQLKAFIADPRPVVTRLSRLIDDPSPYVRRSVANNVNDISKDHPSLAITVCRGWLLEADTDGRREIVKRALRSLVKAGDPEALSTLGHGLGRFAIDHFEADTVVSIGGSLGFSFAVQALGATAASTVIDYRVHYLSPRGLRSPKVFKLDTRIFEPGATRRYARRHPMRPVSVRALVPGTHRLELQVDGRVVCGTNFELRS